MKPPKIEGEFVMAPPAESIPLAQARAEFEALPDDVDFPTWLGALRRWREAAETEGWERTLNGLMELLTARGAG